MADDLADAIFADETDQPGSPSFLEGNNSMADLFGDEFDQAPTYDQIFNDQADPILGDEEAARRRHMEYAEDDIYANQVDASQAWTGPGEDIREANIMLVNFTRPQASDNRFWHVRLPNFLRIDPKPFDEHKWDPDVEDAANKTAEDKPPIPDEHVIRWRWVTGPDGNPVKQSNARLIRWADGTSSLQLGSEMFDVNANVDNAGSLPVSGAGLAAQPITQTNSSASLQNSSQGLTYLIAEHAYCGLFETHARITGTMTFTPTTIASQAHRRLANAVTDRHAKATRTKSIAFTHDPEAQKAEKERKEADENKKQQKASRSGKARRKGKSGRSLLLDSEDDESEGDTQDYDRDDAEGQSSQPSRPRVARNRRSQYRDQDEEAEDDGFIINDEDEPPATTRRARQEMATDDLDDMEEAAERAARRERKAGESRSRPSNGMDIDPPEEADEPIVRKRLVVEDSD